MQDLIRLKGGSGEVPDLQDREPAVHKKNKELYIGINGENVRMCGANDLTEINSKINEILSEISTLTTTIANIESEITNIKSRLGALETSSE